MKLTKQKIERLEPGARDWFEWDDDLAGFAIRVWPSGAKTFVVQYRSGGRTRRYKVGNYGALTVEQARRDAKIALGDVARGEDPQEDRATQRKSLTVTQLCDRYLEAADDGLIMGKGRKAKRASTLYVDRGRIARHIKPLLGRKLVRDITATDINGFIRDEKRGKTAARVKTGNARGVAVVEGGAGAAARTAGLLGGVLSFAVSEGVIAFNPAVGVKRPADQRRDRRLSLEEYQKLGAALQSAQAELETEQAIVAARLLALTGCRLGEIVNLKWSEVDQTGGRFRLRDTKEGASVRPIGKSAFDMLSAIKRSGDHVLPAVIGDGA